MTDETRLPWLTIVRGETPLIVSMPHTGIDIPPDIESGLVSPWLARKDADWWVNCLYDFAHSLGATVIRTAISRTVIDCNRDPSVASSIPVVSETTEVPGNRDLTASDRAARVAEIFAPYHARIAALLDARQAAGRRTVFVAMHSFTPVFKGESRAMQVGVLYNRDARMARIMLALLRAESDLVVGDNAPYAVSDTSDYGVPVHAERRGLAHVEIEIRQDLIAEEAGQIAWAARLARLLRTADERLRG